MLCNYEDFLRYKGTIEKIYGVRAYIKDVPFSDNIEMDLVRLDFDLEYKKISLSPYELLIGYDSKGEPIICNMKIMATSELNSSGCHFDFIVFSFSFQP